MTLIETLSNAIDKAAAIALPTLVREIYRTVPEEADLDRRLGIHAVCAHVELLDMPVVSITGAFSAGKTFLVQRLLQCDFLESRLAPTTSAITAFRHLETRPESWPQDAAVFALKPGADPRSLAPESIAETGSYADLARLTTYSEQTPHDAVVVFLEAPILRRIVLLDCPGVGTLAEAPQPDAPWHKGMVDELVHAQPSREEKQTIREHMLQATAMRCSDAFLMLSSMTGNTGNFSDRSTAMVLAELTRHADRFPSASPHGNILFIGSQADPTRDGLQDEAAALAIARAAIQNQVHHLPPSLAAKLDAEALADRVVLFFTLDNMQRELGLQEMAELVQSFRPTASIDEVRAEAATRFEARVEAKVRTRAFHAAFDTMVESLLDGMEALRYQTAEIGLTACARHCAGKHATFQARASAIYQMEDLSAKYRTEQPERESAWSSLCSRASADLQQAATRAHTSFMKEYSLWEDKAWVETFLKSHYTSKEQAKQFAAQHIQDALSGHLQDTMTSEVRQSEARVLADLADFDRAFLRGTESTLCSIDGLSIVDREQKLLQLSSASAFATFTAITAGLAGGTTLLAVAGSSLATAALTKLVLFGVTIAGTVGVGAAVSGLLLGIPVYGWVLLGLGGLWKLIRFYAAPWHTLMAEAIAKSARRNRTEMSQRASDTVNSFVSTADNLLSEALASTDSIINGHIVQVHSIAQGSVPSDQLHDAATYYAAHEDVAKEAFAALQPVIDLAA